MAFPIWRYQLTNARTPLPHAATRQPVFMSQVVRTPLPTALVEALVVRMESTPPMPQPRFP